MRGSCLLAALLLAGGAAAQQVQGAAATVAPAPAPIQSYLFDGYEVRDRSGRLIHNHGTSRTARLRLVHTGRITWHNGVGTCSGDVENVINDAVGGTDGPITVNTNGQPIEIRLERSGQVGAPISVSVEGGRASVTVVGDRNDVTVGGAGNDVVLSGDHNSGRGRNGLSSGSVLLGRGSSGNAWDSGGGRWIVRN